jgi:hypothetical protein
MRREWADYECSTRDWATIEFLGRSPVKTIGRLVDAWSAAERVLIDSGYGSASIVGSYACRNIRGGSERSLHAFRLALDIDPSLNGRQGKGSSMDWDECRLTLEQVLAVETIRTHSGAKIFRNGYVFNNPDPMHFQIACTTADIDSGVDWATVTAGTSTPSAPVASSSVRDPAEPMASIAFRPKEETLFCQHGDGMSSQERTDTVKYWQTKLVALGQDTGGVDGRFGDKTKMAVQAVVAGSSGLRIGGEEAAQIDIALAMLGPEAQGGVLHQHEEYAPSEHHHDE